MEKLRPKKVVEPCNNHLVGCQKQNSCSLKLSPGGFQVDRIASSWNFIPLPWMQGWCLFCGTGNCHFSLTVRETVPSKILVSFQDLPASHQPSVSLPFFQVCTSCCEGNICNLPLPRNETDATFATTSPINQTNGHPHCMSVIVSCLWVWLGLTL